MRGKSRKNRAGQPIMGARRKVLSVAVLAITCNSAAWAQSAAAQRGGIRSVGTISGGWPINADVAVTTRKGSGLAAPVTLLLNDLIRSGKYTQVLDRWSLGSEAVDKAQTNPPGLPKS